MMRVHWLQHVDFEGLGEILPWLNSHGADISCTRFQNDEPLPDPANIDMLIIMGGPMGVGDSHKYTWLEREKIFIQECIQQKMPILGICLGAQLLAESLGGEVSKNPQKEIGWFPIERGEFVGPELIGFLPEKTKVLHWHGDTFSLPPESVKLFSSAACANQGFICQNRYVGLQFHVEIGRRELEPLIDNCRGELVPGSWIQDEKELMAGDMKDERCRLLDQILQYLTSQLK